MATAARKGGQKDVLQIVTMAMGTREVGMKGGTEKEPLLVSTP